MAVPVQTQPRFGPGVAVKLFSKPDLQYYDVEADGELRSRREPGTHDRDDARRRRELVLPTCAAGRERAPSR